MDVFAHELGIVAARDHTNADERSEKRRTTDGYLLGEDVVHDETARVTHAQRQWQEAEKAKRVEHDGPYVAVRFDGIDRVAFEVHVPDAYASGAQLEADEESEKAYEMKDVTTRRSRHAKHGGRFRAACLFVVSFVFSLFFLFLFCFCFYLFFNPILRIPLYWFAIFMLT